MAVAHLIAACTGIGLALYVGYAALIVFGGLMDGEAWSDMRDALLFRG